MEERRELLLVLLAVEMRVLTASVVAREVDVGWEEAHELMRWAVEESKEPVRAFWRTVVKERVGGGTGEQEAAATRMVPGMVGIMEAHNAGLAATAMLQRLPQQLRREVNSAAAVHAELFAVCSKSLRARKEDICWDFGTG